MYRIKHFDLGTVALYTFIMTFIFSLLFFIPFGLIMATFANLAQDSMPGFNEGVIPFADFGILFLFIICLVYSVFATILYTIIALVYNLLSLKLGGIKVSVEKVEETTMIDSPVDGLNEVE